MLQAGVDIAVIALWLGHESLETTHVYLEIDLAHKEQALYKLAPIEGPMARFTAPDPLLAFLTSLSLCRGARCQTCTTPWFAHCMRHNRVREIRMFMSDPT